MRTPDAFKAVASLDCAFRAVLIDVAQQHRATLIQGENWTDDLAPTVLMNDEALTSGGERFASSSTNPDRVTHDLGLGKAIVVPPLGFEPRTLCLSGTTRGISSLL